MPKYSVHHLAKHDGMKLHLMKLNLSHTHKEVVEMKLPLAPNPIKMTSWYPKDCLNKQSSYICHKHMYYVYNNDIMKFISQIVKLCKHHSILYFYLYF